MPDGPQSEEDFVKYREYISKYRWLFDRLNSCEQLGCNVQDQNASFVYWTNDIVNGKPDYAWGVACDGALDNYDVVDAHGVRPVITVSKSIIYINRKQKNVYYFVLYFR